MLEEGWARDLVDAELLVMHFLLPTFSVAEEQAEDHALRCHQTSQCSEGSNLQQLVQLEEVAVGPLQLSLSSLHRQQQQLYFVPDSF